MKHLALWLHAIAAFAGALLVRLVTSEYVPHVILGLFAVCIALAWSVVAENGALVKGPGILFGQFEPTVKTRRSRFRTGFFCAATAVAGACVSLLLKVTGIL